MFMRRRIISTVVSMFLAGTASVWIAVPAEAASKPRVFGNCAQLNQVYPHGVGKVGAHDKGAGRNFRPVTTFKRDNALYQANQSRLDRDRDGIACEKH